MTALLDDLGSAIEGARAEGMRDPRAEAELVVPHLLGVLAIHLGGRAARALVLGAVDDLGEGPPAAGAGPRPEGALAAGARRAG